MATGVSAFRDQMATPKTNTDLNSRGDIVHPRHLIVALVLVHIALVVFAVQLFSAGFPDYRWPRWQCIFIESLACSQVGMLAAWLAVGRVPLPLRLSAIAIVIAFWLLAFDYLDLNHESWYRIFSIQVAGICLTLVVARLCGVQLIDQRSAVEHQSGNWLRQFSLRQMMAWMVAAACLLNLGIVARKYWGVPDWSAFAELPRANTLGLALVPVVLIAVWATLGSNRILLPLTLFVLITTIGNLAVGKADRLCRQSWWSSLGRETYETAYWYLVYLCAVVIYLSLVVCRKCGYRLAKTSKAPKPMDVLKSFQILPQITPKSRW